VVELLILVEDRLQSPEGTIVDIGGPWGRRETERPFCVVQLEVDDIPDAWKQFHAGASRIRLDFNRLSKQAQKAIRAGGYATLSWAAAKAAACDNGLQWVKQCADTP
jgi:hypothetical protein